MNQMASTSSSEQTSRQRTKLELREDVDSKGRGVFAMQPIRKGDEVLQFLGEIRDVSAFKDLTHALQIGDKSFLSPSGDIDDYVNHSCEPNCGIRQTPQGRVVLFALAPIRKDEEITFDYSTTQAGGYWVMECHCGKPTCRRRIGDFNDLPDKLRDTYIAQGAVLPFLVD